MNRSMLLGFILLVFASVVLLSTTVAFYFVNEQETKKSSRLEKKLQDVAKLKDSIAEDMEKIKERNDELESKLDSTDYEAKQAADLLAAAREKAKKIETEIEAHKDKAGELTVELGKEKEERLKLSYKLSRVEEDYQSLLGQFEILVQAKETLEIKMKTMLAQKGIELERIEVRRGYVAEEKTFYPEPEASPARSLEEAAGIYDEPVVESRRPSISESADHDKIKAAEATKANVLVINSKFNFIVTNIGKADGAGVGSELDIYRNDKFLARTRIDKIYDNMSAATLLPEWAKVRVREGDEVYFSD